MITCLTAKMQYSLMSQFNDIYFNNRMDELTQTSLKFDMENRKEQLARIKHNEKFYIRRVASQALQRWKRSCFSRVGINKGKYRINRNAELAVYKVLQVVHFI